MYHARILITRRPSILEPEGRAVKHALANLGYDSVKEARMGKLADLTIDVKTKAEAERVATEAAEKLLANPVMEDFSVEVQAAEDVAA